MIEEGSSFPSFNLADQEGAQHTLNDLKGTRFVVFCYPKDNTSG